MKMKYLVFSLLFAGSLIVGGTGVAQADDLKISGFADVILTLTDEANETPASVGCSNPAGVGSTTNCTESQFRVNAEVDFEKTAGDITFRLDLDFPGNGSANLGGGNLEQANFSLGVLEGADLGLRLTGGIFNSPVGYEAQDAPDEHQVTHGQLWGLVPSNLAGLQLAGGKDMITGSVIFANDFNDPLNTGAAHVGEENSLGFTLGFSPMHAANLSIGWLDSGILPTEAVLDVVLSGMVEATPEIGLHYAVEYLEDEVNEGLGLTVNATHGKHMLTVRYDTVEVDAAAAVVPAGTTAGQETSSLTVALICNAKEGLSTRLEWRTNDNDTAVTTNPDTDLVQLQFVATF